MQENVEKYEGGALVVIPASESSGDGITEGEGDARYLRQSQNGGDIDDVAEFVDTLDAGGDLTALANLAARQVLATLLGYNSGTGLIGDNHVPGSITRDTEAQGWIASAVATLVGTAPSNGDTLGELHARIAVVEALGSLATDAELIAAVVALIGSASGSADTLGELEALINVRLRKDQNLADLPNLATAIANLDTNGDLTAFIESLLPEPASGVTVVDLIGNSIAEGGILEVDLLDGTTTTVDLSTLADGLTVLLVGSSPAMLVETAGDGVTEGDGAPDGLYTALGAEINGARFALATVVGGLAVTWPRFTPSEVGSGGGAGVGLMTTKVVHPHSDFDVYPGETEEDEDFLEIWLDGNAGFAGDYMFAPGNRAGVPGAVRSKRVGDDFRSEAMLITIDDMPEGRGGSFGPIYRCASGRHVAFVHTEEDNGGFFYSRIGVAISDDLLGDTPHVSFLGDILQSGVDMATAFSAGAHVEMWGGSYVVVDGFIYLVHNDGHPGGFGMVTLVAVSRCAVSAFEAAIDGGVPPTFAKHTATGWDGDPIGGTDAVEISNLLRPIDVRWCEMAVLPGGEVVALLSRQGVQQVWLYATNGDLTEWAIAGPAQSLPDAATTERAYSTIIPTDWDEPWLVSAAPMEVLNLWSSVPVAERWSGAFAVLSTYPNAIVQPDHQMQVNSVAAGIDPLTPPSTLPSPFGDLPVSALDGVVVLIPDGARPGVWRINGSGAFTPLIVDPPFGYKVAVITQFIGPDFGEWMATQAFSGTEWVKVGPTTIPDGGGATLLDSITVTDNNVTMDPADAGKVVFLDGTDNAVHYTLCDASDCDGKFVRVKRIDFSAGFDVDVTADADLSTFTTPLVIRDGMTFYSVGGSWWVESHYVAPT